VTSTGATLSAQVNPKLAPTSYRFQYGPSTAYGTQTPPSESIGEDEVDHPVSESISGLRPATVYHYRIVAVNITGPTTGPDQTFTTPGPPVINSTSVSNVGQDSATLNAGIKPGFIATSYHFEYGLTSAYGLRTGEAGVPGADNAAHEISSAVTGLDHGTTYHFRVVATNAIGTSPGPDQVFTTSPSRKGVEPIEPTECKRGFVKRHGKCVKKHRHHKKHKRRHSGRSH
jgi:phosphodiesterase/alkaline phosphatase D-like protein